MFYSELYRKLGKLFYHIAASDGEVRPVEKEALQQCIDKVWKPLENSTDKFGTDQASIIDFSFDFEESENPTEDIMKDFTSFFRENKAQFTPVIVDHILQTGEAIANAYRGKNKEERAVLNGLKQILQAPED